MYSWRSPSIIYRFLSSVESRGIISGFATTEGTLEFVKNAQLPLYHKFDKAQLYANPIIHGPPNVQYMLNEYSASGEVIMHNEETNSLMQKALFKNKSNCIYVYSYNNSNYNSVMKSVTNTSDMSVHGKPYCVSNLSEYITPGTVLPRDKPHKISRSEVITVADIGSTLDPGEIVRRVQEARDLTRLDTLDCVVWRCTEEGFYDIDQYDKCKLTPVHV